VFVYILTVYILSSDPPVLFVKKQYDTLEECRNWAEFYSEYPFQTKCTRFKVLKNESRKI